MTSALSVRGKQTTRSIRLILGKICSKKEHFRQKRMKFRNVNFSRFDLFLSARFESLGSWIARSPGIFILVPLLVTLLTGSGVQNFVYASDVFYLFVPVDAQSITDVTTISGLFPPNVSR